MCCVGSVENKGATSLGPEEIYQAYPRHKDKRHALASIEKAIERVMRGETGSLMLQHQAVSHLLEKTRAYAASFAGQRGALTPYPATWMNRGGYMDDPLEWEYVTPDEQKRLARTSEANIGVSTWRPL
jgi:hypothetical protein